MPQPSMLYNSRESSTVQLVACSSARSIVDAMSFLFDPQQLFRQRRPFGNRRQNINQLAPTLRVAIDTAVAGRRSCKILAQAFEYTFDDARDALRGCRGVLVQLGVDRRLAALVASGAQVGGDHATSILIIV